MYAFIENNKINGTGQCKCLDENTKNKDITEEEYNLIQEKGNNYFIYKDGELIVNPEYEAEEQEKEKERISNLTCTKRVFALMLQELGVDYLTQLKPLIESNAQAQLEWDLCVELLRSNPMLDLMASQLGVTSEQLDKLFLYANGEITLEEFKGEQEPSEEPEITEEADEIEE